MAEVVLSLRARLDLFSILEQLAAPSRSGSAASACARQPIIKLHSICEFLTHISQI
jgi:hypothetical protein